MFPGGGGLPPGMNAEQMQRIQQALMSNPEALALLSNPEVMQKFQRIAADPSSAAMYRNDPDIQKLIGILQSSGLGGGMGGMGGMGGGMGGGSSGPAYPGLGRYDSRGGGGSSSSARASEVSAILKSDQSCSYMSSDSVPLFTDVLQEICVKRRKLCVVDFFATWCGPCVRISPELDSLQRNYHRWLTVLKIDVDKCHSIARHYSVTAMPTFMLFGKDASKIAEMKGANSKELESLILRHSDEYFAASQSASSSAASSSAASASSLADDPADKSPYVWFPVTKTSLPSYSKCPFDKMKKALSSVIAKDTHSGELSAMESMVTQLSQTRDYHSGKQLESTPVLLGLLNEELKKAVILDGYAKEDERASPSAMKSVIKNVTVLLDVTRMVALHPSFAAQFDDDWLRCLTAIASESSVLRSSDATMRTLCRVFINLLSRNVSGVFLMSRFTSSMISKGSDSSADCVTWSDCLFRVFLGTKNSVVRSAFAQILLYVTYYLRLLERKKGTLDASFPLEIARMAVMHLLTECITQESDPSVLIKLWIAVGTAVYSNAQACQIAAMLGLNSTLTSIQLSIECGKMSIDEADTSGVNVEKLLQNLLTALEYTE